MISEKIKLLESFKQRQISKQIEAINNVILSTLKSSHFNPRLAPYFNKINDKDIPFADAELQKDPNNISQIKKLINALYYARLAFLDLEHINIKHISTLYSELYKKTIHRGYQACYLLTHLDVDVKEMFSEEIQLLIPLMGQLQNFTNNHSKETKELAQSLIAFPLSAKIGEITGIAVDQMQPNPADLDVKFLTKFSANLPSYIQKLTNHIKTLSPEIREREPALNNQKLEELQNAALSLLTDLQQIQGNSIFVSLQVLKYIHIIRNIITLSMSSLQQMQHLTSSSQDVIRDNLAQLKYVLLPSLFSVIDKIEVNAMLNPGTLSVPMMNQIKPLYEFLIYYASKPVNFKEKGEELLSIEDGLFLKLRLEGTYGRIDAANKNLFKIQKAQEAFISFYQILDNPLFKNKTIQELPNEIKEQLLTHYKLINPYLQQADVDLSSQLIDSLQSTTPQHVTSFPNIPKHMLGFLNRLPIPAKPLSYIPEPVQKKWAKFSKGGDHISFVLAQKNTLQALISKQAATQQFHIDLNMDLINNVNRQTNLVLFPYSEKTNVFTTDESAALNSGTQCSLFKMSSKYDLRLKTIKEPTALAPQTFYIEIVNDELKYSIKNSKGQLESAIIPWEKIPGIPHDVHLILKSKAIYLPTIMEFAANLGHSLSNTDPSQLHFKELAPLLNGKSALILFINDEQKLIYANALNKTIRQIDMNDNQDAIRRLKIELVRRTLTNKETLELVKSLTGEAHLCFAQEGPENLLSNPEDLTADQALDLYQWYRNKRDKFLVAKNAYDEFITILKKQSSTPGVSGDNILHFDKLDTQVKAQCRNLYNLFQPYFINGVPADMYASALFFDKFLVHSFVEETETTTHACAVDMFDKLDEHFQKYFTEIDLNWGKKSRIYLKIAQAKFTDENNAAQLNHDSDYINRGHHLIKHTNYSKYIREFRMELSKVYELFNNAMQTELTPLKLEIHSDHGVGLSHDVNQQFVMNEFESGYLDMSLPFPNLQNPNQLLAQSKQVIAIKKIFNSLYHVEGIVRALEQLDDRSNETTYMYHIYQSYGHIDEIIKLTKDLAADPHFGLIARDLLEKGQTLLAIFQEHSDAYTASHLDVNYNKPVVYNALWYSLNAFHIIPKHIRSLTNRTDLTVDELNQLHLKAKKATTSIEAIIKSSNSYVHLFLQTPNMIRLYSNLTAKMNEFLSTSHDTVINNLKQFNPKLFIPMLLEADEWEFRLGLKPGIISGPLKNIIDEFHKGLLGQLKLNAAIHIPHLCDKAPLETRIVVNAKKIDNAREQLKKLELKYTHINALMKQIESYVPLTKKPASPKECHLKESQNQLIETYKQALPRLNKLKKRLSIEPGFAVDIQLDAALNSSLKEYEPKLENIKELVIASHHYFLGLKATYQMQLDTAQEKLTYLTELSKAQEKTDLLFIEEYTTESFNTHMKELSERHIGLQNTYTEYIEKLANHLESFKSEIIDQAKTTSDINLTVKNLLKEKVKQFEEDNYISYYHLDRVRVALNHFLICNGLAGKNSLFEDEITLTEKAKQIRILLEIAENKSLTVDERFADLEQQVSTKDFSRIMLAQKQTDFFSFTYIIQAILSLFEALHLYTPERKKLHNDLKDAINIQPQIGELTRRFGLFATRQPFSPEAILPMELEEVPTPQ